LGRNIVASAAKILMMGKTIIFMRHGKAADAADAFNDFERPLVGRGREETEQTAKTLQENNLIPEMILSSPATRTAGTAQIAATVFDYPAEHVIYHAPLYMGRAHEYIDAINNLKADCILVVGHNPEMQALAFHFGKVGQAGFPTSSAVALQFQEEVISPQSKAIVLGEWLRR
jgi:phosphohistidine phosphatase